jgi:hypothetical protein
VENREGAEGRRLATVHGERSRARRGAGIARVVGRATHAQAREQRGERVSGRTQAKGEPGRMRGSGTVAQGRSEVGENARRGGSMKGS